MSGGCGHVPRPGWCADCRRTLDPTPIYDPTPVADDRKAPGRCETCGLRSVHLSVDCAEVAALRQRERELRTFVAQLVEEVGDAPQGDPVERAEAAIREARSLLAKGGGG